jgi:ABC-type Fe3+-hydroxamate transport system substrate-binding protein
LTTKRGILAASLICAALLSGCGRPDSGARPVVAVPQRIVSLGPAITQQLFLLGVGDKLVGVTTYCRPPEGADPVPQVASIVECNVEKILMLKPDLVLATSMASNKQIRNMKGLGINVVAFTYPRDFKGICEQFEKIGELTGVATQARTIIEGAKSRLQQVAVRTDASQQPSVFIQVGVKPLFTANNESFLHDLVRLAGGINIAANAESGIYSREKVVKEDPDHIVIVTMGVSDEEKKTWRQYDTLKAARKDNIHLLDSYKVCSPTPLSFVDAVEKLAEVLHPDD